MMKSIAAFFSSKPPALAALLLLVAACAPDTLSDWENLPQPSTNRDANSFITICYHNVADTNPDQRYDTITTEHLAEQMGWLKHEGFHPVSIDDLIAARDGVRPLPPRAVLLSFDDGYESFYTRAFPILKAYQFPVVIAVVDEWMKGHTTGHGQPGDRVRYGDTTLERDTFLSWAQIREMQKSGLIEVASHSHDLHYGIVANPQGNTEPRANSLPYDTNAHRYGTPEEHRQLIDDDLEQSARTIEHETGKRPRVMVWPYGAYSGEDLGLAQQHGMPITLTLNDGPSDIHDLANIPRFLIKDDPNLSDFAIAIRDLGRKSPQRVVQVNLDDVYDADPDQLNKNIDALIKRIHDLQISTVYLQALSDSSGTGLASGAYFPNRVLPMRADLFNRIAWQLNSRAETRVYALLPVLSFDLGPDITPVMAWAPQTKTTTLSPKPTRRVSPFDPKARMLIGEIYEDMARQSAISGVLFHDDALLSDYEDASPPALAAYRAAGLPDSIEALRADPVTLSKWTAFKTKALIDFTHELLARVETYRKPLVTVRNIDASPVLHPQSEASYAQNYKDFLGAYSYAAIETMPGTGDHDDWMRGLIASAKSTDPNAMDHTVFELQAVDQHRAIPATELGHTMRLLTLHGALNFGYAPDNFKIDTPEAAEIHKELSLQSYMYTP